jgi:hypothetical protein
LGSALPFVAARFGSSRSGRRQGVEEVVNLLVDRAGIVEGGDNDLAEAAL